MTLYQEIILLSTHFKGNWVVENVKPYYKPLIEGQLIQRHMFWSNKEIEDKKFVSDKIRTAQIKDLELSLGFDLSGYKLKNKRQVLRNCVKPEMGKYIFDQLMK